MMNANTWWEQVDGEGLIPGLVAEALRNDDILQYIRDNDTPVIMRRLRGRGATGANLADIKQEMRRLQARIVQEQRDASSMSDDSPEISIQYRDFELLRGFMPAIMGGWLFYKYCIKLGINRKLYRYNGEGLYVDCTDWLKDQIRSANGQYWKAADSEEVIKWLTATIPASPEPPEHLINCKNGYLNWRTLELEEHGPHHFFTSQVSASWSEDSVCPEVEKFLSEALPYAGGTELGWQIIGYVLHNGTRKFQKAFLLDGDGGNGKSVWLDVLRWLIPGSFSSRSLRELVVDKFATADLFGKVANICGDIDVSMLESTDIFKQITGEDETTAQNKFKDSFTFVNRAVPIFSANGFPISKDHTSAWFDRWIILPFPVKFRGTDLEDPDLKYKLKEQSELDGAFRMAVLALQVLMADGKFSLPEESEKAKAEFILKSDSVAQFLAETIEYVPAAGTGYGTGKDDMYQSEVYNKYKDYCEESNLRPVGKHKFNGRVETITGITPKRRNKGVVWPGFREIVFIPEAPFEQTFGDLRK